MTVESRKRWNFDRAEAPDVHIHNGIEFLSHKAAAERAGLSMAGLDYYIYKKRVLKSYTIPGRWNFNSARPPMYFRAEDIAALREKK